MFLQVDVDGMGPGSHPVQLTESMVMGRPPGAEITEIFPRVVEIEIEQLLIKPDVVVSPEILGKPADNYDISSIRSDPPIVRVSGPRSIVEKIVMIRTQQVNVDGMQQMSLDRQVRLVPPHPQVNLLPESVNLRIRVDEKSVSRKFEKVEVKVRGAKYQTTINPARLDVWVQGPLTQINQIRARDLTAFVTLSGKEPQGDNLKLDPQLEIASSDSFPGVRLERFSQSYVDVLVSSRPLK
jgi:YbbR domain-containing protein